MLEICEVQGNLVHIHGPASIGQSKDHQYLFFYFQGIHIQDIGWEMNDTYFNSKSWHPMTLSSNSLRCRNVACLAALECHCGNSQKVNVLALPDATPWAKVTDSSIAKAPEQVHGANGEDDRELNQ